MIESVRVRLALWHSGVLAVLLLAFAAGTYSYLARSGLQRTDELLREAARAFIVELDAASGGANPALSTTAEVARDFRLGGTRVLVFDAGARLVAASPVGRHQRHADPERIARALAGRPFATTLLFTVPDSGGSYRVYTTPTEVGPRRYVVAVVESLRELRASLDGVRDTFVLAIPLALLLSALGGYVLARRSLAPVSLMSERAARIGAGNLDERLPVPNPRDELGRLARTFNELLARLEGAFGQQRRFMTDAAHELRTPVAILRGEADVALARDDRPAEEYRGSLRLVREESRRLSGVVDDLFLLARADAGEHLLRPTDFYLNDLVEECVRSARALAAARRIDVEGETDGDAPFRGDEAHLHRLLVNLLDNAIKYSPPGTRVTVTMRREDGRYRVSVRDAGIPVAPELRERIFERFFRAGTTGGSHASGAGLGLAIARWAAEAHGGALVLLPSGPGGGNEFILWLPVPAE